MSHHVLGGVTLALLSALFVVVPASTSASAAGVQVRLHRPKLVHDGTVAVLKGKVTGRKQVRIQRYAPGKRRWTVVRKLRVRKNDRFSTRVRTTHRVVRYRAVAGGKRSVVRRVRRPASNDTSEPSGGPSDACGPQPRKADGSYWSCTLHDDFDGTELNREIWRPQVGFKAGSITGMPCYIDDPSVISVRNGALHLTVREVAKPVFPCRGLNILPTNHVAGGVDTHLKWSQQYGRFEARYKNTAARVPGLHEAFWLWPDARYQNPLELWPAAGEIDIAETYSQHPDLAIPFLHYTLLDNLGPRPGLNTAWDCHAARGVYNTYTLEWSADRIEIFVNGKSCLVNTSGDPAFQKPYIMALTQMLGAGQNGYTNKTPLPATMSVDYVKVWE